MVFVFWVVSFEILYCLEIFGRNPISLYAIRTLLDVLPVSLGVSPAAGIHWTSQMCHGGGRFPFGDVVGEIGPGRVQSGTEVGRGPETLVLLRVPPVSMGVVIVGRRRRGQGGHRRIVNDIVVVVVVVVNDNVQGVDDEVVCR